MLRRANVARTLMKDIVKRQMEFFGHVIKKEELENLVVVIIIIISCHQTIFFYRSVHAWAVSLNSRRSSKVQGCARSEHCNMWAVLSASSPHSHVVSPLKYPHIFLCSLLQVYPVLSLFRHLQLSQGLSCPVARPSYRLTKPACAFSSIRWLGQLLLGSELVVHF